MSRPTLSHTIMVDHEVYAYLRKQKLAKIEATTFEAGWDRPPTFNDILREELPIPTHGT